jgi:hypothetical protein
MVIWCFPRWNRFWTMYMTLMFLCTSVYQYDCRIYRQWKIDVCPTVRSQYQIHDDYQARSDLMMLWWKLYGTVERVEFQQGLPVIVQWYLPRWNRLCTMYMTLIFPWWLFFVNREATLWSVSSIKSSRMITCFSLGSKLSKSGTDSVRRYLAIYLSLSKINSVLR